MVKTYLHQIYVPSILKIGESELNNIGKHLKKFSFDNIALFLSDGIEEIFGDKIFSTFEQYGIKIAYKNTVQEIQIDNIIHTAFSIPKSVKALVGIGGGKALDYSKYCAHVLALPFISVPTSTSNDGFCSPTSSLIIDGRRKTVNSSIPYGVIVDIDAVKTSPESCLYSGIGDLISKITAGYDWKEAVKKGNDVFHDFAFIISQNTVLDLLNYQNYDLRDNKFLYHLINSLLMSGLSMEIAGSSRPASGSEHLISHAYDMISDKPRMHGIQVGVATYLCSYLQNNQHNLVKDFLTNTGFIEYMSKNPLNKTEFIEAIRQAPMVKENFYTVLSEPDAVNKAIEFINSDEILKKLLIDSV